MTSRGRFAGAWVLSVLLAFTSAGEALASPGDVVVPAHRTRDGHYVPANVPPLSAGTHLARRPGRGSGTHRGARPKLLPPILVEARPVRH